MTVFTPEQVQFLQSGCGLIVGSASAANVPSATRGWGCIVIDRIHGRVRLLVDSDDPGLLENLAETGRVAVTGADVLTLRSAQVKGTVTSLGPVSNADRATSAAYCEEFFSAVDAVDSVPRHLIERLVPVGLTAVEFDVDECFDQTPGPTAGTALPAEK